MGWWDNLTATIWRLLDEHGLVTAFVLLLLEEAGVPPLIPGDLLMILVGAHAATGKFSLLLALAALQVATLLGGSVLYFVSAWGGHDLVYRLGRYIGATPQRLDTIAYSLDRHGFRAIVLGRLVTSLCILTGVACGVLGFPYRRYLPALAIGGFLHLLIFVMVGYIFGPSVLTVAAQLHLPFEMLASLVLFIGLTVWMVRAARAEWPQPASPRSVGERLHAGILAGVFGAILSTLLVNVLIYLFGLLHYDAPSQALEASGLLGNDSSPTLMMLIGPAFVILPTIWGAVYAVWPVCVLPGPSWLRGALFASVPLAFSLLVILPLIGAGPLGIRLEAGPIPALGEAVRHLAYGLTLGITFAALSRRERRPLTTAAPQPA